MGSWELDAGVVLLLGCVLVICLAVRRIRLMRGGGVDVSLRRRPVGFAGPDRGSGWHSGAGELDRTTPSRH